MCGRCALYCSYSSSRKVFSRASQATTMFAGRYSETILRSIWLRPKSALVGCPAWVAMDSGSAKNARNARLLPSSRKSRS